MIRPGSPARRHRTRRAITVIAATTLTVAACGDDAAPSAERASGGPAGEHPGMVHVHGLGIDPADDSVYVATHHGLFRLSDTGPELVGTDTHDLMGFTVAGPGHFYASGHPTLDDDAFRRPDHPPLLGLIETTDAGETWRPLSLLGEADFHALTVSHGTIWGHDATTGRLLASTDGRTWEHRAQLDDVVLALAVNPTDPQVLVTTTPDAHLLSTDGGRTWTPAEPALAFASWDTITEILWGIDSSGTLWTSPDAQHWEPQATTVDGHPEALVASAGSVVVATSAGIHQSTDGGTTWTTLDR
jgi:hypothetical protein